MSFSQYSGTAIVPLIGRIVLFAAFLPMGFQKIFHQARFEGSDAQILNELNIGKPPKVAQLDGGPFFQLAAYQDDSTQDDAGQAGEPQAERPEAAPPPTGSLRDRKKAQTPPPLEPEDVVKQAEKAAPAQGQNEQTEPAPGKVDEETGQPTSMTPESTGTPPPGMSPVVEALSLHKVTVLLVNNGWKKEWKPQVMAWLAGLTELLGGAFILVGLFTRLWGLGLAVTMGFAFYLTSWPELLNLKWFGLATDVSAFNQMFCQLGLFVLAVGVMLTGAGPASLDRFFFGGRPPAGEEDDLGPMD